MSQILVGTLPDDGTGDPLRTAFQKINATKTEGLNVQSLGAKGDGVTDDTAIFQAASLASLQIIVPPASYVINGMVTVRAGQTWQVAGATFIQAGSTIVMFDCNQIDEWSFVGPFTIQGSVGLGAGTAVGIRVTDSNRWRIDKPIFKNIKGAGLLVQNLVGTSTYRGDQGQIICPQAYECDTGLWFNSGSGAEYCTVVAPHIVGCNIGIQAVAGNTTCLGGNVVDNVVGVQVTGGANHAHGIFSGVNINHSTTYSVLCSQVTLGQDFNNCHFYDDVTNIFLDRSIGIVFNGGHMAGTLRNDSGAGSGPNYIRGVYMPQTIAFTGSGLNELIVQDCTGVGSYVAGVTQNDPSPCFALVQRDPGATQALVSGTPATLLFPTENFDRRNAFSAGIFTVPVAMAGTYRFLANLYFTGTAMQVTNSFVDLRVNGTSQGLFLPGIFGTTILTISVSHTVHLSVGDTVILSANIAATNPLFGGATWRSTFAIERIA